MCIRAMADMTEKFPRIETSEEPGPGRWGELLDRKHVGAVVVFASGVALCAIDGYIMVSLLPTAVHEVGGQLYYAWVLTVFLVASVLSTALVSRVLSRYGPRRSYAIAFGLFGSGMVVCALSNSIVGLLLGRLVQGLGGGLLSGLGYAVINHVLPKRLWERGTATVSAMWGVGTVVGPALGGYFAQYGDWHDAFWTLAVATVLVLMLVPRAMPTRESTPVTTRTLPLASLALLFAAVLLISIASVLPGPARMAATTAAATAFLGVALAVDRRSADGILPKSTYSPTVLKWIYLAIVCMAIGNQVEGFVPLFGQRLGNITPIAAGFLASALALGWTVCSLASSQLESQAAKNRVVVLGPLLLALGLAVTGALQAHRPPVFVVILWAVGLAVAGGGIGMTWPHLAARAMGEVPDRIEANKASAAVGTSQGIGNAFGAALSGVMVNLGGTDLLRSAHLLFFSFAAIGSLGFLCAVRSNSAHR
jgi:MFS family permease